MDHDTTIVKIDSKRSPRGAKGERYLASGVRVAMRLWEGEAPGETDETERDYETVGYVIGGRAELRLEGQVVRLEPGDSYVVPRHARHHYRILEAFTAVEATSPPAHVHGRDRAEAPGQGQGGEHELGVKERFISDVESRAALPARVPADSATAAVMCTLTERLTAGEAHELLESLPRSLRPLFERCIEHRRGPVVERVNRAEFLDRIATHLDVTPAHAEVVSAAVFEAVRAQLPQKLIGDVAHQLPGDLQDLWLRAGAIADRSHAITEDEAQRILDAITTPLPPGTTAGDAFSAVMCALFDRLSGGEVRHVLLGLPSSLRLLVQHCAVHRVEHAGVFDRKQLLNRVRAHLGSEPHVTEAITREVFAGVRRVLPEKEVRDVASQLPEELRELWGTTS